jgi:hypothetical protein
LPREDWRAEMPDGSQVDSGVLWASSVIPRRRTAATQESITPDRGYGLRLSRSLSSGRAKRGPVGLTGMTARSYAAPRIGGFCSGAGAPEGVAPDAAAGFAIMSSMREPEMPVISRVPRWKVR